MNKLYKEEKGRESIALSQIFILLIGVFAFVWMIGGIPGVSAEEGEFIGTACNDGNGNTGTCQTVDPNTACSGGTFVSGKCPGSSNIQCCIPKKPANNNQNTGDDFEFNRQMMKFLFEMGENAVSPKLGMGNSNVPINNPDLAKDLKNKTEEFNGTGLNFLGGFGNLGGAVVNSLGAIGASYGANRLFSYIADEIDANGPWTIGLEALGAGTGAFAFLYFVASVNPILALVAAGVAILLAILFGETVEEQGVAVFYCLPWDAQTGGQYCDLCNNQEVPCSEYQCKSLGQACEFEPSSEEREGGPSCFFNNTNDIDPPVIMPNSDVLTVDYVYEDPASVSYPDRGTKIINTEESDGCLTPFSRVTFGVKLNELAKCKISFDRRGSYNEMSNYFGRAGRDYNHTQTLLIPELDTSLGQDNQIFAYVRCQDANGNSNPANYVFQMCVQEGPDLKAPEIYGTSIKNDSKVAFSVMSAPVDFYINEPANCKWSFTPGRPYGTMENNMSCSTDPTQINLRLSYTCSSNLTGLRQDEKTNYYVKCQDVSERLNTNVQDYVYTLSSSRALSITSASPNNTVIKDSTNPARITLRATTFGGTYDGSALCYYSNTGYEGSYIVFDNSSSTSHSTDIYLNSGNYNYSIKCHDFGGNAETVKIQFDVEIDSVAPLISRAYYDEGNMKIITNEKAECQFSTSSCEYVFGDGVAFNSVDGFNHKIGWQTESTLYIKCQDIYGNQPASASECSMTARGYNYQI
ncbi:MAG: hypothetical protein NUV46_00980 [Nanoarchaeota archaeon]|nr:hypothetical protein [Nanoarchaeota archaeon]